MGTSGISGHNFALSLAGTAYNAALSEMVGDPIKHREAVLRSRAKNRERRNAKAREPANREKKKQWKIANREKIAEQRRKHRAENKEAVEAYSSAWRLANREHIAEYQRTRYPEKRDAILASNRAYKLVNRDKVRRQEAAHYLVKKSINAIRHDPEKVYWVVSRAVSSALPKFMRDDVINSMLLAVLEGKVLLEHVGARMKDYISGYNREYDTFKTLSLDAPMGGSDLRRIDLLEAPEPYDPKEDEEEDPDIVMLKGGRFRL